MLLNNLNKPIKNQGVSFYLNIVFFSVLIIEIYAEFVESNILQWIVKPLLIPVLFFLYLVSSLKTSRIYCSALFFNWLANLFFINNIPRLLLLASVFFMLHRILIIVMIFKSNKTLGVVPILLGAIPFFFLFLSLISMVSENIQGVQLYLIGFQTVLMTILGGYSLGNFIINNGISSKLLLISSLFFGLNLFVLGIKFYFLDMTFLKPISMIFFVFGHYVFYQFMISHDNN
ncbi:hypothetical protein [Flavobacterium sp.]|uniref:hypothetical protein n=1 Tax=Flavobacterium sp. TaxID=239 RepID=UPI0037521B86